jgi:hypothetical protein
VKNRGCGSLPFLFKQTAAPAGNNPFFRRLKYAKGNRVLGWLSGLSAFAAVRGPSNENLTARCFHGLSLFVPGATSGHPITRTARSTIAFWRSTSAAIARAAGVVGSLTSLMARGVRIEPLGSKVKDG